MRNALRYLIEAIMFAIAMSSLIKWEKLTWTQLLVSLGLILFLIFLYVLFISISKIEKQIDCLEDKFKRVEDIKDLSIRLGILENRLTNKK